MTAKELCNILKKTYIPFAHIEFSAEQSAPYMVYVETDTETIVADNQVAFQHQIFNVELYHDKSDMDCEIVIETQFRLAGIVYEKTTQWLQDLGLLETIYTIGG